MAKQNEFKVFNDIKNIEKIIAKREKASVGKCSFFSILIPLVEVDGKINILYELRAKTLKRQPGEISFPGGKIEIGETAKEAAIRETCEELNIEKNQIELVGEFDTLYGNKNFVMYTFVGIISREVYDEIKPNTDEVEEVFLVPIEYFAENPPQIYEFEVTSKPVNEDIFQYEAISKGYTLSQTKNPIPLYPWSDKPIWGLTGRITESFIKVLTAARCNSSI